MKIQTPFFMRASASKVSGINWGLVCAASLTALVPGALGADQGKRETFRLRAEAVSVFTYNASERRSQKDEVGALVSDSPPEVVPLETMEVSAPRFGRGLEAAMERYRMHLPQNSQTLGTGVVQKDYGKFRVSKMSVLYVPIQLRFSW